MGSCGASRSVRASSRWAEPRRPERSVEHGAKDGDVDCDDADNGFADTPGVDVEGRRVALEGEGEAGYCCADDEGSGGEKETDDDFSDSLIVSEGAFCSHVLLGTHTVEEVLEASRAKGVGCKALRRRF